MKRISYLLFPKILVIVGILFLLLVLNNIIAIVQYVIQFKDYEDIYISIGQNLGGVLIGLFLTTSQSTIVFDAEGRTITKIMKIAPEKVKDVIGRGGETITKIILEASDVLTVTDKKAVKVDLEDDGRIIVYHNDYEIIDKTLKMIEEIVREAEVGKIYKGKVVKVEDFGCFVQLWPGCEGLVHISHLSKERVNKTSDVVKLGDEVYVKSLGFDRRGRLNLSIKEALVKQASKKNVK